MLAYYAAKQLAYLRQFLRASVSITYDLRTVCAPSLIEKSSFAFPLRIYVPSSSAIAFANFLAATYGQHTFCSRALPQSAVFSPIHMLDYL